MKFRPSKRKFVMTLGQRGEILGWKYLQDQGYEILEKNYRCKTGEIDVVARKNGRILFIEIKTRSGESFGTPEEAVDLRKQGRLVRAAEEYLARKGLETGKTGFEVLSVRWKSGEEPEFRLIAEAFEAPGAGKA